MSGEDDRGQRDLSGWMEAERAGRLDEADVSFAALFAAHAVRLEPPDTFADAVAARALAAADRSSSWRAGLPVRLLVAASIVLMGLPLALFGGVNPFDVVTAAGTRLAPAAAQVLSAAAASWSLAGAAWSIAAAVGEAALAASSIGHGPLVLLLNLLAAAAGYAGLRRLLAPRKECW